MSAHVEAKAVPTTQSKGPPATKKRAALLKEQRAAEAAAKIALTQAIVPLVQEDWPVIAAYVSSHGRIPTVDQVRALTTKMMNDKPPWVHWSKTDASPQLWQKSPAESSEHFRLTIAPAQLRGYRMARASHGVSKGCYYFECVINEGPSVATIASSFPPHARLGQGLKTSLQRALLWEENQKNADKDMKDAQHQHSDDSEKTKKRKLNEELPPRVGGNVRLGWSMRTGDLQAPVGYDKWSYAIRDISGSIIHESNRQDTWGGEELGPGDVIGCAIILDDQKEANEGNHIRFFKNGRNLGEFVLSKGKRLGGEAFAGIESGMYYPAVSSYLGGSVRANFGPHFICNPRKLPPGMKLMPVSSLCRTPPSCPPIEIGKKLSTVESHIVTQLEESIKTELKITQAAYGRYLASQVTYVKLERQKRGYSINDLPKDAPLVQGDEI